MERQEAIQGVRIVLTSYTASFRVPFSISFPSAARHHKPKSSQPMSTPGGAPVCGSGS